jgi:hypothetical protein
VDGRGAGSPLAGKDPGKTMTTGNKKLRVLIIFLTHGSVYKGAYEALLGVCGKLGAEKRLIVVRNDHEELPVTRKNGWIYEMGGDNSVFEFSGWQKAIQSKEAVAFSPDVYLFANDAFLVKGFYALPVINDDILAIIATRKLFGGNLRKFGFELKYRGMKTDSYITTHFFAMSAGIVKELGSFVSETSAEEFMEPGYSPKVFRDNELWDPRLKKDLLFSLTHKYHEKGKRLLPGQYDFFTRKILCVVNEILLSARVNAAGYRSVDLVPFPELLNSYFTVYTPFTTIRPFQFMRKIALSAMCLLFCNGFSRKIGAEKWFKEKCGSSLIRGMAKQA